eukprot:6087472-Amphidinium_carterae.2
MHGLKTYAIHGTRSSAWQDKDSQARQHVGEKLNKRGLTKLTLADRTVRSGYPGARLCCQRNMSHR